MNLFIGTLSVGFGILLVTVTVPVLIWLLFTISEAVKNKRIILETKLEIAKKKAPYDEIQVSQPPNQKMFTIRLIKSGEVVHEQSHNKDLNDDNS